MEVLGDAPAAAGVGPAAVGLPLAQPWTGAEEGAWAEGFGGPADRSALPASAAPQPEVASVSPRKARLMRCNTARFSASRSLSVTRKPGSGGGGRLRGSPRLRGSRGNLRFRGPEPSEAGEGERFLGGCLCPQLASWSSPGWLLLWENAGAEEGA